MDVTTMREVLTAVAAGRGAASVAIIDRSGADPQAQSVPASDSEPAFLAYSMTKAFTAALILTLVKKA